jgi:hypothetical protein
MIVCLSVCLSHITQKRDIKLKIFGGGLFTYFGMRWGLTTACIKMTVVSDVTPYILVNLYKNFEETAILAPNIQAAVPTESLVKSIKLPGVTSPTTVTSIQHSAAATVQFLICK